MTLPDDAPGKLLHLRLPSREPAPPDDSDPEDHLHLPVRMPPRPGTALERAPEPVAEVVEAEVVDEQLPIRAWSRRLPAPVQRAASGKNAERAAITAVGVASLAGRAWDGATQGVYRRQIKAAEAGGDREALEKWTLLKEEATQRRHERLRHLPGMAFGLFGMAVLAVVTACFVAFVVAVFAPLVSGHSFTGTLAFNLRLVGVLVWACAGLLLGVMALAPVVIVAASYREGQRRGDKAPSWVTTSRPDDDESAAIVTPLGVAEAIVHLNIGTVSKAVREGWQVGFDTPPVRVNNRGYQTVFSLPLGVTPGMIADKRDVLARNLHRAPLEVWPTAAERPGYVDLWVADRGSSTRPTPEYPLLHSGEADVFDGVPAGVTQRGDELVVPIVGANYVAGGQMGQGKSNLCRVIMLGCATDPLAVLWVHVFAGNGDFDAYRPRLSRYCKGSGEDTVWAGLESLRELYEETGRREARIAELGAKKVTRGLAKQHADLRPIIALFSECHELFGSTVPLYEGAPKDQTVGRAAGDYAVKTIKRARKTGISLGFDTQSSRAAAIPPAIVELVGVNACFSVKTWRSNDGFLGDGSFESGIRATELRFNVDRGTCLVTGASDEVFELVKTYFIAVDDDAGRDDAVPVIERVMAAMEAAGQTVPSSAPAPAERRDLLDDMAAVLRGDEPVPVAEIPPRLRQIAPSWAPYERLKGNQLRALLDDEFGYRVPSTGNRWPVDPGAIRALVADRDVEEADSE